MHPAKTCATGRGTGCEHCQTKPSRSVRPVSLCFQSPRPHSCPQARCAGSLDRLPLSPTVSSSRSSLVPSTLDAFPRARSRQDAMRVPKATTSATYVRILGDLTCALSNTGQPTFRPRLGCQQILGQGPHPLPLDMRQVCCCIWLLPRQPWFPSAMSVSHHSNPSACVCAGTSPLPPAIPEATAIRWSHFYMRLATIEQRNRGSQQPHTLV